MKKIEAKRIAERYVKVLFDVAQAASAVDAVESDLNALGKALAESAEFRHFLTNPLLPQTVRAQIMEALLAKMNVGKVTGQFIAMLVEQKRLAVLPEIIELFSLWASISRGELQAELVSATDLKAQQVGAIEQRLEKAYGKKMKLDVRQDPALLGGVVVKIGSVQLDGSLAGKMRRLKQALQAA